MARSAEYRCGDTPSLAPRHGPGGAPARIGSHCCTDLRDGLTCKEIAGEFDIALGTVATQVGRICEKLHVHNRRGIIAHYKAAGGKSS